MNRNFSRRDFLKGVAAGSLGIAAGKLFGTGLSAAADGSWAAVNAANIIMDITWENIFTASYSQANRRSNPDAAAPETPEEYIASKADIGIPASMIAGTVAALGIPEEQFMNNKPAWLGDEPDLSARVSHKQTCDVLIIGSGQAGTAAALRCADLGLKTVCCEVQTWEEYDNYASSLASCNSRFFLDRGAEKYDPNDIFTEYMNKALGHANQKIVMDYARRSGEALDWLLSWLPEDYVARYAHACNCTGSKGFRSSCSGSNYYAGTTQWRDIGTEADSNVNMWPYTVRLLQQKAVELGAEYIYGAQGLSLVHHDGKVTGAIFTDIDGRYFQVNARAVVVAAGDFGGNPDMRLDLCDQLRNLAWSYGLDRSDVSSISSMGRDGSGIRMMLWAGATMEAGPRAGHAAGINSRPEFPFGGVWPVFGNNGRRFFSETLTRCGSVGYLDMLPEGLKMVSVTDANWERYCDDQAYDPTVTDRSNAFIRDRLRRDMDAYVTGPDGFPVQNFAAYGREFSTVYAADTLEELADILGYEGADKESFLDEIRHWNEMCEAGYDSDWGADRSLMHFKIQKAPFFAVSSVTGGRPSGGLCQHAGVCTDGWYRVLTAAKAPISGLYAVGNCCGQRYAVQYPTPAAGNSCGSAFTTGYLCAEYLKADLEAEFARPETDSLSGTAFTAALS